MKIGIKLQINNLKVVKLVKTNLLIQIFLQQVVLCQKSFKICLIFYIKHNMGDQMATTYNIF